MSITTSITGDTMKRLFVALACLLAFSGPLEAQSRAAMLDSARREVVTLRDRVRAAEAQATKALDILSRVRPDTVVVWDTVLVAAPPSAEPMQGIWIGPREIAALPTSGSAWTALKAAADRSCGTPDLSDQSDPANVCVMAKALVYARTGQASYRDGVIAAVRSIAQSGRYNGRALSLGRELAAYVIAADLVDLKTANRTLDQQFRAKLVELRTAPTSGAADDLVDCHEKRPNNWGTMCGASRVAIAAYLGDRAELDRAAAVFRGYLGERDAYAGFSYGDDLSWQCDPSKPVGINPRGCTRGGLSIDGVLPDDQRRGGAFNGRANKENYAYEALQGAVTQAWLLHRQGYSVWMWGDQALLRAYTWLHSVAKYPAEGDDTWQPHVVNYVYGTNFPAPTPARAGKIVGWTDWTHKK